MTESLLGALIGIALGAVLIFEDFGAMLVCALFGLIGFVAVQVARGELDLTRYLGADARRRRAR